MQQTKRMKNPDPGRKIFVQIGVVFSAAGCAASILHKQNLPSLKQEAFLILHRKQWILF